ncbi:PLP-dependent aminotransferase family protein [Halalkalibacter sp. APA_J-10(15)]|uniref:aminotransferase-like domain-containing protein n=1 Tax=Halalkalibacter sp. APA_J-10(15) TaxID=2933805 RepID=UPI001FF0FF03|nr:PLP-dependent aminotransferase family protein [Halalkalibacter sp. APA_J-10(15)]MCK0473974.1 PLP-dependent aminotransferase family protein [Halalkalibacter sp. APA_J-10(15)]
MLKYESIFNELLRQIQSGEIPAGTKLPSIRKLKQYYSCSISSIQTALKMLEEQHLIYSIPKSGYYVIDHQTAHKPVKDEFIDFATASPTWHNFPYKDFQHCINKAIDTYQEDLFQYGTPNGLPSLIIEARKLLETYQVFANTSNIYITSGVQRALSILSMMPFPNNRTDILVEQPSYHLYLEYLQTNQIKTVGIRRTVEGIDLEELEGIFREGNIKFFYCMPRFHNPLGTSFNKKEKEGILKLATKYDVYIVEDDYIADFEQDAKNDPLFSLDVSDRVIYLKSFSKIMFPGLRIGFIVLPTILKNTFQKYKRINDIDSSVISQAALELYLKSGMFMAYQDQVSKAYTDRAEILQKSLKKYLPMYKIPYEMVMHTHITMEKKIDINSLIHHLKERNVLLDSINQNYLNGFYRERILKINVSNIEEHKIVEGIKEIANELNKNEHIYF